MEGQGGRLVFEGIDVVGVGEAVVLLAKRYLVVFGVNHINNGMIEIEC